MLTIVYIVHAVRYCPAWTVHFVQSTSPARFGRAALGVDFIREQRTMSTTPPTWIGRLSTPALILLHTAGAIIGAGVFLVLAAIVIDVFKIKSDGGIGLTAIVFLLTGLILPSLLLCRARRRSIRASSLTPPLESESIHTISRTPHVSEGARTVQTSTETAATSRPPAGSTARNYLREAAEYNSAQRQAKTKAPNDEDRSENEAYSPASTNKFQSLLQSPSRRWRWWCTFSTVLSVIVILACFLPSFNISIPSANVLIPGAEQLDLKIHGDSLYLYVTNVGEGPVTITAITVNNRDDCPVRPEIFEPPGPGTSNIFDRFDRQFEQPFTAQTIKVGDTASFVHRCRMVRVVITTDQGSETFTLSQ
jgi:hypothetical protein